MHSRQYAGADSFVRICQSEWAMLLTQQCMLLFPSYSPSGFCNHEFKAQETIIVMLFKLVPTRGLRKSRSRCSAAWLLSLDEDTVNGRSERCCTWPEGRGSKVMGWAYPGFDIQTASGGQGGSLCLLLARDLLICCDTPVPTTCVTLCPGLLYCGTIHSLALCHTAVACVLPPPRENGIFAKPQPCDRAWAELSESTADTLYTSQHMRRDEC